MQWGLNGSPKRNVSDEANSIETPKRTVEPLNGPKVHCHPIFFQNLLLASAIWQHPEWSRSLMPMVGLNGNNGRLNDPICKIVQKGNNLSSRKEKRKEMADLP